MQDVRSDSEFDCEDVSGASGEDSQRNMGSDHAVRNFVDGAVPSSGKDEIRPFLNAPACDPGRGPLAGCRDRRYTVPPTCERLDGTLKEPTLSPVQSAGERVVNEISVLPGRDNAAS